MNDADAALPLRPAEVHGSLCIGKSKENHPDSHSMPIFAPAGSMKIF